MTVNGSPPPSDMLAERAVLGAVLLKGAPAIATCVEIGLSGLQFFHPSHRMVWEAAVACETDGVRVDLVTVAGRMRSSGTLQKVDGEDRFLSGLLDDIPTTEHVVEYAKAVVEAAARRQLMQLGDKLRADAARGLASAAEVLAGHEKELGRIVLGKLRAPPLRVERACDLEPEPVDWLWRGYLPGGMLSLLVGNPGTGKTNAAMDIAARWTSGIAMPFEDGWGNDTVVRQPGRVLFLSNEDSNKHTMRPRAAAAGADLERMDFIAPGEQLRLPDRMANLEAMISAGNYSLVIFDPLETVLGRGYNGRPLDINKGTEVREALNPLRELAERTGVSFLILHHTNKKVVAAIHAASGSNSLGGIVRSFLMAGKDGEDRVLAAVKVNVGREGQSLAYTVEDGYDVRRDGRQVETSRVRWIGPVETTGDDMQSGLDVTGRRAGERRAGKQAQEILRKMECDGDGAVEIRKAQEATAGIVSARQLQRIADAFGLRGLHHDGFWRRAPAPASPDTRLPREREDVEEII